ncbi:HNH endonuclease signature motif containing protein [Bacillus sp. 31A1R]|uniref:HNH endonuclease signature motif containing protein n=1 Tax=Robertmurraya mangrovi TaxID=3098077 RepID=A0ABU5ISX8_9BACI|nr:HNH endonuclease signature motif containing protein [Bacillus sp. 31A1R]MDZ5470264.1 HNH endonuclease signature motif containing protein [Bacillus sp. 31A1R]
MGKKKSLVGTCELCLREEVEVTVHHLTPKELGGTFLPTALLCYPCHKQIHAIYTNEELAARMNTIERLRDDEQLKSYVKWINKQPASKLIKVVKSNDRKRRSKK